MPSTPDYTNLTISWQHDAYLQPSKPGVQALLFNIITVLFAAATLILTAVHIISSRRAMIENLHARGIHFWAKEKCGLLC